jgi:hypothetical protein
MKRLIDFLLGRTTLKNRPGGMAWVQSDRLHSGAERLLNSAVKTVSVDEHGMWRIEPVLGYVATAAQRFPDGSTYIAGDLVLITGMHDSALEPWKESGVTTEEVTSLYAPQPTTRETTA